MREKERKIIFLSLLADRFSKYFFYKRNLAIINKGISFGLLNNKILFLLPILLILLFLISMLFKKCDRRFSICLMIIGGLSNLFDRLVYGGVMDFINFPPFPSFNLADVLVVLGMLLIIVDLVKAKQL